MEYEYSFRVSNIKEYIAYCVANDYLLTNDIRQTRIIFRNDNGKMARITIEDGKQTMILLDFKEDKMSDEDLNIRRESPTIEIKDIDSIKSILDFLNYKEDNTLIRKRQIYEKENVSFEIDTYEKPFMSYVVAIEGEKSQTDLVYCELKDINKIYKIK